MNKYRTRYHLLLDRSNAKNPRWVIAKEYASRPANLPADYTVPPGRTWLREVGVGEFDWLRRIFGRDTHVTITEPGSESPTHLPYTTTRPPSPTTPASGPNTPYRSTPTASTG